MRHLIAHFNALFLGIIMGMIFVALVYAPASSRQQKVHAQALTVGYEIIGSNDQTTVLLIAGTTTHLVRLPASVCAHLVNQRCHASPSVASASFVIPATHPQVRK